MGQQQLLLVILVTIVVGIATVVAINTFGSAADAANQDAVRQDLVAMGAAAQGFYNRPRMLGGGSRSFIDITMHQLAFSGIIIEDELGVNENGTYEITDSDDMNLTITAFAASEHDYNSNSGSATFIAVISSNDVDITLFSED
jgi:hypothetical protein